MFKSNLSENNCDSIFIKEHLQKKLFELRYQKKYESKFFKINLVLAVHPKNIQFFVNSFLF